jgi:cephalosporin hydroxylase
MIELLQQIWAIKPKLDGADWCDKAKTETLVSLVIGYRPAAVVEIGVFGGGSLIPMAMAMKRIGGGAVFGIDPWSTADAIAGQTQQVDRDWWASIDMDGVYQRFLANLKASGSEEVTKIIRRKSNEVEPPNAIGLLHVDGLHNDQAVTDVVRFAPKVELGGFCVSDDSRWHGGGPARAEQRLVQLGFKKRFDIGTGAAFQRIR